MDNLINNTKREDSLSRFLVNEKRPLLIEEAKNKPWVIDLRNSKDVIIIECYFWKAYQTGTKIGNKDRYYFLKELLETFWLNEIEIVLEDLKAEVTLIELKKKLSESFLIFYGLKHKSSDSSEDDSYFQTDVGIAYDFSNLIEFLSRYTDKFYIKKDSVYAKNDMIRIGLKRWLDIGIFSEPREIIKNEIVFKIFKKLNKTILQLENITFRLNRLPLNPGIPKPFSMELVEEIISEDQDRFEIDKSNGLVKLVDDLDYISKVLIKNQYLLKEFNTNYQSSGFLALIFVGKDFPLKEASDYVATRPIIYLKSVNNLSIEFSKLPDDEGFLINEFIEYLRAILPDQIIIKDWIKENLTFSFLKYDKDEIKKLHNPLIEKLSPILNVNNNPGNLFQYTLKSKLEEYYIKFPKKKRLF